MMWDSIHLKVSIVFPIFVASFGLTSMDYFDEVNQDFENCICVPYWQCKEDYSGLIEDGLEIMDVRMLKSEDTPPCTGDFDVCCKMECGRQYTEINTHLQRNNLASRIYGAENTAEFAEFPWMLGILENKKYLCGASLIHPRVALTAAHCVCVERVYKVRAGEWNWENLDEPVPHQDRMTKQVIIHPYYQQVPLQNDIALLLLESAFTITENVGVVCIPPPMQVYDYSQCTAAGWGRNPLSGGTYQPTLKKIELPVVPNDQCARSLGNKIMNPFFHLHESFICAGGENKDTCKGDGGGPLFCPIVGKPHRYEQIGIVSWGLTCGMVNTPGVYVNVALFSEWINSEMIRNNLRTDIYKP